MTLVNLVPLNEEPETYHGIPVLKMHDGDPIPTPRAPFRYAVHVSPELARYLLTFNHPDNRSHKPRKVKTMVADMTAGHWMLSPQCPVFSTVPFLINGQNTLEAVIDSNRMIWLVLDFGWPDILVRVFDHNSARTTADTLKVAQIENNANVASGAVKVWQYDRMVGTSVGFSGMEVPSALEVLAATEGDELWQTATRRSQHVYRALAQGGSTSVWAAAYYIIARERPTAAESFFAEVADETGDPGSVTRELAKWFTRRPYQATKTGDSREPLELIIRAFNAWLTHKRLSFPKYKGFVLSRIK